MRQLLRSSSRHSVIKGSEVFEFIIRCKSIFSLGCIALTGRANRNGREKLKRKERVRPISVDEPNEIVVVTVCTFFF